MQRRLFPFGSSPSADVLLDTGVGVVVDAAAGPDAGSDSRAAQGPALDDAQSVQAARLTLFRKLMLSLMGIGIIASIIGGSMLTTHSSFTATVVNPSNTFASGTLKMTNSASASCTRVAASACGALTIDATSSSTDVFHATTATACDPTPSPSTYKACELPTASNVTRTGQVTITNSGTLPATMSVALQNIGSGSCTTNCTTNGITCSAVNCNVLFQYLNFSIYDQTAGSCVYPSGGTYDSGSYSCISNLATLSAPLTSFPGYSSLTGSTSSVTLPQHLRTDGRWDASEAHTLIVAVELPAGITISGNPAPDNAPAYFDLVWTAVQ